MTRARTRTGQHNHRFTVGPCRTCGVYCTGCRRCQCAADAEYGDRVRADVAAGQDVREGKAFGGPRDGIKLTASARWDGKLTSDETGHYVWAGVGWQWNPSQARARRGGRSRR